MAREGDFPSRSISGPPAFLKAPKMLNALVQMLSVIPQMKATYLPTQIFDF